MNISAMITDSEDLRSLTETCPSTTWFTTYLILRRLSALTSYGRFGAMKQEKVHEIRIRKSRGYKKLHTEFVRKTTGKTEKEMEK
jgi:hypothetical protein